MCRAIVSILVLGLVGGAGVARANEGAPVVVVAADPEAVEGKVRGLLGEHPYELRGLPDELEVAGLWLLGASPSGLCPTPSLTADEVATALADAQRHIDEVEVEEGQARLSALRNRLGCLDSPADPEALWSLHFLEAVTAHFVSGPEAAGPALHRALAVRPGAAFDESYPPDLRDAYLAAQREVMAAGWAKVLPLGELGERTVLVDGTEVPASGLELMPGEHLLQLRSAEGLLRGGSLVLGGGEMLVVGAPKKLSRDLAALTTQQQADLVAWLTARLELAEGSRVWIADSGRDVAALGEGTGLVRPAGPATSAAQRGPLLQVALGGGFQSIGHWIYGAIAIDASIRLAGPLRLQVFVRPAIGSPSDLAPGEVPVVVPFGLGPQLRLPGKVHLRLGGLFQLVVDSNESPDGSTRVLVGGLGTIGVDIPLKGSPLALRPSFEGGVMGPDAWPVLRGLFELVLELGGER
jgi:hypothetical protein